jgi:hypothetical protein
MDTYGFYAKAAAQDAKPDLASGASGYFSAPSATLDPNLFDGDHLKSEVRAHIMVNLYDYLEKMHFNDIDSWLHVWLAGSGITYQWDADRGNGDLDVLFGISFSKFSQSNPGFAYLGEADFAAELNEGMKNGLWPKTAHTRFGGQDYEVTYFLNPGTGSDITQNLNPYAAYSLTTDSWTVKPPEVPQDPRSQFPAEWFDVAARDTQAARNIVSRYKELTTNLNAAETGSAAWHTSGADLQRIVAQASAMFDDIHSGRRAAFSPQGHGYADWNNFRWQSAKQSGAVQALHAITTVGVQARQDEERQLYGAPIDGAEVVLRRAAEAHNKEWN